MLNKISNFYWDKKIKNKRELYKDCFITNEVERQQWVQKQLRALPNGAKILDAGAGECQYKKYCSHLEYVAQDFCQYDGSGDNTGGQMGKWDISQIDIICDIVNMPLEDETFDVVLCTEVLEHILKPSEVFKELVRVLKKGGILILTAPFCSFSHFAPYHYCTGFNKYWYEKAAAEIGMEIIELSNYGNYFDFLSYEMLRLPHVYNDYIGSFNSKKLEVQLLDLSYTFKSFGKLKNNSSEFLCYGYFFTGRKI